jgi:hypothetical protein
MAPVARRRRTLIAISATLLLGAAAAVAGAFAGLGQAGEASNQAPRPYLRHPEFARQALLLANAAGAHVTPALKAAARAQSARSRTLWSGASARFSVFNRAAAPSQLPAEVHKFATFAAGVSHVTPDTALARMKLLRPGLGAARGALYAFEGGAGAPCFILTHYGGTCGSAGSGAIAWIIGGGHDDNPDVLVGLAPDNVTAVALNVDGRDVPVSLDRNVVYAQFPLGGKSAEVATTHGDGTVTTEHVTLDAS